jgi:hypothetical protein
LVAQLWHELKESASSNKNRVLIVIKVLSEKRAPFLMNTPVAMKNLMTEIRKCEQTKYVLTHEVTAQDCDERGRLHQWVLFNLVEKLQEEPAACLATIAPQYKKDINHVSMRLYAGSNIGDKLEFEARFYEVDKRQVELKIFVRKVTRAKTSKRVCRAGYRFKAVYEKQSA